MSLLKNLLSKGGITPPACTAHRSCPSSPQCPQTCLCVCLRSSVTCWNRFPWPHPLLLLWCDSAVLADTPEGEIQLPLLACACAAGLGWRKANSHSDWFYLKFLTVNLRCALTYFHLLSSFLEDYFILFFFLRDCLLSHRGIIDIQHCISVCKIMIWYTRILWNDHMKSS